MRFEVLGAEKEVCGVMGGCTTVCFEVDEDNKKPRLHVCHAGIPLRQGLKKRKYKKLKMTEWVMINIESR